MSYLWIGVAINLHCKLQTGDQQPLPRVRCAGLNTKILASTDPDGWKVVFVDEADFLAEL